MHSDYNSLIEELLSSLESLKEFFPEHASIFASANNGIEDSRSRALIGKTRLARMAQLSVASSAASVLKPIIESGPINDHLTRKVDRLMDLIRDIAGTYELEQEPLTGITTPRGWKREEHAFTKSTFNNDIFTISKRSNIPGGEWTVFFFASPVSVAENIGQAIVNADAFMGLRNRAKFKMASTQAPMPPRPKPV